MTPQHTHTNIHIHRLPEQPFLFQTHTHILPHTLCIHATALCSLWSELLSDTKRKNPEWCVTGMNET